MTRFFSLGTGIIDVSGFLKSMSRRNTVHDLTALRLHGDGRKASSSERQLLRRRGTLATQDNQGNWIAHDAGGTGRVKTRRSAKQERSSGPGDADEEPVAGPSHSPPAKGKGRATGNEDVQAWDEDVDEDLSQHLRLGRQGALDYDISFLDNTRAGSGTATGQPKPTDPLSLPEPSSVSAMGDVTRSYIDPEVSIGSAEMYTLFREHILR